MEKVSIIMPCRRIDSMTEKCIEECLKLDYGGFEILVLPDEDDKEIKKKFKDTNLKIIPTAKKSSKSNKPGIESKASYKKNLGMKKAKGGFFAFIDSDAYPKKNWLKNVMKYFDDKKIGIVGGPNLTPPEGNFWEKVIGYALGNFLCFGHSAIRNKIAKNRYVSELPSSNYIVRKEAAVEYSSDFLTAEDTKFCFDVRKKGFKILYANDVVVYHHRRDSLKKYFKQIFGFGRDNLWLMKEHFSFNKIHFLITGLGVVGFFLGMVLSIFFPLVRAVFSIILFLYFLLFFLTSIHENLRVSFWVFFISVVTPFIHGFGSLYGLFSEKKKDLVSAR